MKKLFTPISLLVGLGAGQVAKKLFDVIWSRFDDEQAPEAKYREIEMAKLVPALLVQGAVFKLVKGLTDHGLRHAFANVTGTWPGDERPQAV